MRRGLGVIDRFNRLRHEPIVGRDNKDNDVGNIGAARSHCREGSVPWCVDKRERRPVATDAIGADMLRDSASLARSNTCLPNSVHQRCLPMINVSHERDNGCPRLEFFFLFNDWWRRRDDHLFHFVNAASFFAPLLFQNKAMVFRDLRSDVRLDRLIDVREDVVVH